MDGSSFHVIDLSMVRGDLSVTPPQISSRLLLENAGHRYPQVIRLEGNLASSASLRVSFSEKSPVRISGPATVTLSALHGIGDLRVRLDESVATLAVEGGMTIAVEGPKAAPLAIEVRESAEEVVSARSERPIARLAVGDAENTLSRFEFQGPIEASASISVSADETQLNVANTLDQATILATGNLILASGSLVNCRVAAHELTVSGPRSQVAQVGAGCDLTANTALLLTANVTGTATEPVKLMAGESVWVTGTSKHLDISGSASNGVRLGAGTSSTLTVAGVDDEFPNSKSAVLQCYNPGSPTASEFVEVHVDGNVDFFGAATDISVKTNGDARIDGGLRWSPETKWTPAKQSRGIRARKWIAVNGDIEGEGPQVALESENVLCKSMTGVHLRCTASRIAGHLSDSHIEAGRLAVTGRLPGGAAIATSEALWIESEVAEDSSIDVIGNAVFAADCECRVTWRPEADAQISATSLMTAIDVDDRGTKPSSLTLELAKNSLLQELRLGAGTRMRVNCEPTNQSRVAGLPPRLGAFFIGADATLIVDAGDIYLGKLTYDTGARIEVKSRHVTIGLPDVAPGTGALRVTTTGELEIEDDSAGDEERTPPEIDLDRGTLDLKRDLAALTCASGFDGSQRELNVERGVTVADASGETRIGAIRGRVFAKLGSVLHISGVTSRSNDAKQPFEHGVLVGVSLRGVDDSNLPLLAGLRVLEADSASLIDDAKSRRNGALQEQAQRLRDIAELVTDRAVTGGSRAAARWAAIHGAVLALPRKNWVERIWRLIHRFVFGYGYSPSPPALAFLVWLTLLVAISSQFDRGPVGSPCPIASDGIIGGPYSVGQQIARAILMPLHVLKYDPTGSETYALYGNSALVTAFVTLITALLLGGVLLAARNYLRSPHNRRIEDDNLRGP